MARAKKKKKEVVLTKENLQIQPRALILRGINPTTIGNRVTIVVERRLKKAFKEMISSHVAGKEWKQLSIFATEEVKNNYLGDNKLVFDIHMNEIVDDPKHYQDAFNAVCKIADVMVWAPIANEQGEITMARTPMFTLLAKTNMEKSINEKTGEVVYRYAKRTRPEIGLVMEKAVAEYLFSMEDGYGDYLDYPALEANDKYYFPIYAYLSQYKRDVPPEVVVDYVEFRRILGFEDVMKDGEVVFMGYDVFSQFNKRVLKPCMDEMKENADSNISDIWFDVEKIYLNGRASNPDKLKFIIHLSELGKTIMEDQSTTKEMMEIEQRLRDEFKQTNKQIRVIMKGIPIKHRDLLKRKMNELISAKKAGKLKIESDEGAYWNVAFTNFIEKIKSKDEQEECLPFVEEIPVAQPSQPTPVVMEQELPNEEQQKWGRAMEYLRSQISEQDYNTWFDGTIALVACKDNELTCYAPSRSFVIDMEERYITAFSTALRKEWGDGVKLYYTFEK